MPTVQTKQHGVYEPFARQRTVSESAHRNARRISLPAIEISEGRFVARFARSACVLKSLISN